MSLIQLGMNLLPPLIDTILQSNKMMIISLFSFIELLLSAFSEDDGDFILRSPSHPDFNAMDEEIYAQCHPEYYYHHPREFQM